MSRPMAITIALLVGVALGVVLAFGLRPASDVRAQPGEDPAPIGAAAPVAIAPGPGGMWIVYGNRLRVCVAGERPAGIDPFTPECGEPLSLY